MLSRSILVTLLIAFSALALAKQWKDVPAVTADPAANVAEIAPNLVTTDSFLANCGLETLEKLQYFVAPPGQIDSLSFENHRNRGAGLSRA